MKNLSKEDIPAKDEFTWLFTQPNAFNLILIKKLTHILSIRFPNGFRIDSPIEITRFRRFAIEDNTKIHLTDDELIEAIVTCGIYFEGKVYIVSQQTKNRIKELANDYFKNGANIIFYSEFFTKNENWLFEANIVSRNMLIGILRNLFPELIFTSTYFGLMNTSVPNILENEILRVWGNETLLSYKQLGKRLLYIPLARIKSALTQNSNFIWNNEGTFSHVTKINITEEENEAIREIAREKCNAHGYFSIVVLPFGEILERNHDLSITAIHNAVFRICLSENYDKNGKIVTRKGFPLDALTIMKNHCRTIDKCSLNELLNYEKKLTGESHRWIPMEAGNTVLIRIDKNTYIADKYIHFNSEEIDAVIVRFLTEDYVPLKFFTAFGTFPDCGQPWNLFLLESYCRRFSKNFRFDTPSVNSRNAGTVIRKSCTMTYTEIMADAVTKSGINLSESTVCLFLFENGYIGRRTTARVGEIVCKAKTIRERKG